MKFLAALSWIVLFVSCFHLVKKHKEDEIKIDTASISSNAIADTLLTDIKTENVSPAEVVQFAETLIGTPYLYGSTNPQQGFDCSGFITYVFNHFKVVVPRSSEEFTNAAPEVLVSNAKPGDLILFTGTDSTESKVGHMGIVISNNNIQLLFIHSSSGKANGVTITPLNDYYKSRFVKVIRIFPQNN